MLTAMDQAETQLRSCPHCAAQMPAAAAFCPGCGRPMPATERARGKVGILSENVAGGFAYLTFIPAILFLFLDPYRKNRFVRFHSLQCILLWGAGILLAIALKLAGMLLFIVPVAGPLFVTIMDVLAGLAAIFLWLALVVKALQGEMFKLPWLGEFAEQHAGAVHESS
jgi:uncharacterized membrane protein